MLKGSTKLIDERTSSMECAICGATHQVIIKPDSGCKLYREDWQCIDC